MAGFALRSVRQLRMACHRAMVQGIWEGMVLQQLSSRTGIKPLARLLHPTNSVKYINALLFMQSPILRNVNTNEMKMRRVIARDGNSTGRDGCTKSHGNVPSAPARKSTLLRSAAAGKALRRRPSRARLSAFCRRDGERDFKFTGC